MPYHPNAPRSNDNPSNSQADLLDNFGQINTSFATNHVGLTVGSNSGMHTKVTFPKAFGYTTDPGLTSPASSVYPKTAALGTSNELFFQNGSLFSNVVQLTGLPLANGSISTITQAANGVVTTATPHGLTTGNLVTIYGAYGMTQVNGVTYTITVTGASTFQLNVNTSLFGVYTGDSAFYTTASSTKYGLKTPWGLIINMGTAVAASGGATLNFAIPYPMGFTPLCAIMTNKGISPVSQPIVNNFGQTSIGYKAAVDVFYFIAGK